MNYIKTRTQIVKELERIDRKRKSFKISVRFDVPTGKVLAFYRRLVKDENTTYFKLREASTALRGMFK